MEKQQLKWEATAFQPRSIMLMPLFVLFCGFILFLLFISSFYFILSYGNLREPMYIFSGPRDCGLPGPWWRAPFLHLPPIRLSLGSLIVPIVVLFLPLSPILMYSLWRPLKNYIEVPWNTTLKSLEILRRPLKLPLWLYSVYPLRDSDRELSMMPPRPDRMPQLKYNWRCSTPWKSFGSYGESNDSSN